MAKRTTGSRVFMSMIGLSLAAAGGIFTWLMWQSYSRALEVDEWEPVPCVILESTVAERRVDPNAGREWRFEVSYLYDWEGESFESNRYRLRGTSWSHSPDEAEALVAEYPEEAVRECRVNPQNPEEAVLVGESKGPGYSIWFPLVFVVGGLGVVAGAWKR